MIPFIVTITHILSNDSSNNHGDKPTGSPEPTDQFENTGHILQTRNEDSHLCILKVRNGRENEFGVKRQSAADKLSVR